MSTSLSTLIRLRAVQNKTRLLFKDMSDLHYRLQYHPNLSPLGWYLAHGHFLENFWLHETIQGNNEFTQMLRPDDYSMSQYGALLPPLNKLITQIQQQQDSNDLLLMEKVPPLSEHPLFLNEFIENYLIQQYALDYENIFMVLTQIALKKFSPKKIRDNVQISKPLTTHALIKNMSYIKKDQYNVGGERPFSLDNECPAHQINLNEFNIADSPISNGNYLQFMQDDGYQQSSLWSEQGWYWREKNNITHPEHWKKNAQGNWFGINYLGAFDLNRDDFVCGLNHYEASAFATWAGARLPHEHEWEVAVCLGLLKHTTEVWEWCSNTIYPYDGFSAYPDKAYSQQLFDNQSYLLKGASPHTRHELKRASFRYAQPPQHRHIFAGLRLVFD